MTLSASFQHGLGGDDFLAQPRGCDLHINDDPMICVDQVVGFVAESARPVLQGPRGLWVDL